ncbi:MAG: FecR family protein, partial [Spirochaetaceae bacterium]|nr:FecR family protein [Spirochaetaceae bacterium]
MKRIAIGLLALLLLPALAAAQAKPSASVASGQKLILEFVDGLELTVTGPDKSIMKFGAGIFEGDPVPVGSTIATGKTTSAELKLKPNGTIFKLAKSTTFTVSGLATTNQDKNAFALVTGKVRAVAAKGAQYQVTSQTTVCAVRGTDFAFDVKDGSKAILAVAKGLVQFDRIDPAGAVLGTINVAEGMMADAFAASFQAIAFTAEQYAEQFGDVAFQSLLESDVPEQALESEPTVAGATAPTAVEPGKEIGAAEAASMLTPDKEQIESGIMKWLREALGMEIGSVTIAGTTYSKAIIQP